MKRRYKYFSLLAVLFVILPVSVSNAGLQRDGKSINVKKNGTLNISISFGNIKVNTWDKNEVNIMADDKDSFSKINIYKNGNTVNAKSTIGGGDLEVFVPTEFNLNMQTAGGEITVKGDLKGNINAATAAGEIFLDAVKGNINLNTSGGNIKTGNIQGDAKVKTAGGEVSLGNVKGLLNVATAGGSIRLKNVGKMLHAAAGGGNIYASNITGNAKVATGGGIIELGMVSGNADLKTGGGSISLKGAKGKIEVKTGAGDISLKNIGGSLKAKTGYGDITVEMFPSLNSKSEIKTGNGDIELYVPQNAKTIIEARIKNTCLLFKDTKDIDNISSDFKAESTIQNDDKDETIAVYKLNGGGSSIILKTSIGKITIKKQ